ncbi:transcriptional regulator with XRE-family HTH domain [Salinibacterium sp. CAN_S4]|uniref:helix-turn-helix domain-containing protein n=1 Tax=Salinibacterium sp. CAN_S4 TaxID=2787727 RepID=UPI0018EF9B3E
MTNSGSAKAIGSRIQALRRARGMRTSKDLADAIGGTMTVSIIENIELGRKANLDVSQLLNIAMALQVPPSYILAPMNDPSAELDLPGLSSAFDGMTAIEFDAWLASIDAAAYMSRTLPGRNSLVELNALREWHTLNAEIRRLHVMLQLEEEALPPPYDGRTRERLQDAQRSISRLGPLLNAGGWDLPVDVDDDELEANAS